MDKRVLANIAERVAGLMGQSNKSEETSEETKNESYRENVRVNTNAYAATSDLSIMMQEILGGLQLLEKAVFEGSLQEKAVKDVNDAIVAVAIDAQRGMLSIDRTIRQLEMSVALSRRFRKCRH
jgi:hypothetical protein